MPSNITTLDPPPLLPAALTDRFAGWLARSTGALVCLAGAAACIALLSWSASDSSFSHAAGEPVANLLGSAGAIAADVLLQTLGLAAALALLVALIWGVELLLTARVVEGRRKVCLALVSVLALAGGCSALPMAASWRLPHGFGGFAGHLVYSVSARMMAAVDPARARHAAGLMLLAGGLGSLMHGLALSGRTIAAVRRRRAQSRLPRTLAAVHGFRPIQSKFAPDPALHLPHQRKAHSVAASHTALPARSETSLHDPEFEEATERASCIIAARFAPPSMQGQARVAPHSQPRPLDETSAVRRRRAQLGPSLELLNPPSRAWTDPEALQTVLRQRARRLEEVLATFGVRGHICAIAPGPVVTRFELEPARGVKSARVIGLADDIARAMNAGPARIAAVAGHVTLGIELPNPQRETVTLREILETEAYHASKAQLPLALGHSSTGAPVVVDLAALPHLLLAGGTTSDTAAAVNAAILSLLFRLPPEQCRFVMMESRSGVLSAYEGLAHLHLPAATDAQQALWATVSELEERGKRLARLGVRTIVEFNDRVLRARRSGQQLRRVVQTGFDRETGVAVYEQEALAEMPMPYLVLVADDITPLMTAAARKVERAVLRLSRYGRAAGIHMIMATERPSGDILTAPLAESLPARIAFRTASKIESRRILGDQGAEQLLDAGDMLFAAKPDQLWRVQGACVTSAEAVSVAQFLRAQS